jgi:hypothetical protein
MRRDREKDKIKRDIKYLNKDFGEFRRSLINHTKNYFPDTFNDFNESSPGMMFLELGAYVGDVLSYYTDVQLRESILTTAREKINLYNLSTSLGYKPRFITAASVDLDVYQLVPSIGSGDNTRPDFRYALTIDSGMVCTSTEGTTFRTNQPVDFSYSSSLDETEVTIYSTDSGGEVEYYLLRKCTKATSGTIVTREFTFQDPKPYDKITLPEDNVIDVISIVDSDSNTWYEVDYLAQDLVPIDIPNMPYNDQELSAFRDSAPFILYYRQTEKRFTVKLREDDRTEVQFGSGVSSESDEQIVPNPFNVGSGLPYYERVEDLSVDPKNFLYTRTYGQAPFDTTLTVTYTLGQGVQDNVEPNSITTITSRTIRNSQYQLDSSVYDDVIGSLYVNNPTPARGAVSNRSVQSVREEAISNLSAQNRTVTKEDYILRCYTMPPKYGAIAKAYVEQDTVLDRYKLNQIESNPLALNLYVLGYDSNKNFTSLNSAVKNNLSNYLRQYRMMTDSVNIKNAFIVNIGVSFELITSPGFNSNEVLLKAISNLQDYFDNDNMQIGQPILINDALCVLTDIEGVRAVNEFEIFNLYKVADGYSGNYYPVKTATRSGVVYPPLDPSIFEVKYPKKDIIGRISEFK